MPMSHLLLIAILLFHMGLLGIIIRKKFTSICMAIVIAFAGIQLTLLAFSLYNSSEEGILMIVFFAIIQLILLGIGIALSIQNQLNNIDIEKHPHVEI